MRKVKNLLALGLAVSCLTPSVAFADTINQVTEKNMEIGALN